MGRRIGQVESARARRLIESVIGVHACLRDAREAGVHVIPVRDEVVTMCVPYARRLAGDLVQLPGVSRIDQQDIEGAALLGLVEGVDNYQPSRGVQIQTHLWNRIRKRVNEERVLGHWSIMRPPSRQADRYMAGRMSERERDAYIDTYVRPFESELVQERCVDSTAAQRGGMHGGWG